MLSYQWFSNITNSAVGGTSVPTATSASFALPPDLTEGTHFFFVEVRASGGAAPVRSTVAVLCDKSGSLAIAGDLFVVKVNQFLV